MTKKLIYSSGRCNCPSISRKLSLKLETSLSNITVSSQNNYKTYSDDKGCCVGIGSVSHSACNLIADWSD